jgi:hypothetical protein
VLSVCQLDLVNKINNLEASTKMPFFLLDFMKSLLAHNSARKRRVRQATPKWADLKVIEDFYKNRPEGFHVDHIIPLKGKNICGLHVIENLQYLSEEDNLKKHNRF